jgi:hypothetical protein
VSATHRNQRPKGYIKWEPTPAVAAVVHQVQAVLNEYRGFGPMTVRQVFYRLVGQYGYPKDERAYKRLGEYLVRARRAQLIGFDRIRDDGTVTHSAGGGSNRRAVWEYLTDIVGRPQDFLRLDRNSGQPYHLELWCEAAGMAPMLAQMVRYRDVTVYSTGGFSSVTVTYEVAQRVLGRDRPTYFLHVGDYDPSGESIFTSMSQDVGAFVVGAVGGKWNHATGEVLSLADDRGCLFVPRRVALTEAQVEEYDLPTAPAKVSDTRSARWVGETTQAEALPPTLLEQVVRGAIDELTDPEALAAVRTQERDDKARLSAAVDDRSVEEVIEAMALEDPSLLELVQAIAEQDLQS